MLSPAQANREVLSVSALNRRARGLLEGHFPIIWVEGEISNLSRPSSGHFYFSLKDSQAQVRCALFRPRATLLECQPANGMQVIVRARVSLYEGRGEFQLIVEQISDAGAGALQRAFEALKQRLQQEGLFATERKRPLPALPQTLGLITSPQGAAIRDVLSILRRRFPALKIIVYPSLVQGTQAPAALCAALETANHRAECDLLLLTRGGGSAEDLAAFNDEKLARMIVASQLPVISAVGHESDVSISDFCADLRAPTPSAAAELLSPDRVALLTDLQSLQQRLQRQMQLQLRSQQQYLQQLQHRLKHPQQRLESLSQRLDNLEWRLQRALPQQLSTLAQCLNSLRWRLQQQAPGRLIRQRLHDLQARLLHQDPHPRLDLLRQQHGYLSQRLAQAMQQHLHTRQQRLHYLGHALDTISPLATLQRGYAIVRDEQGQVLRHAKQVQLGQQVTAKLSSGDLCCRVETINPGFLKEE